MLKKSKKITFYGRELEVFELEVSQVTEWLEWALDTDADEQFHQLDELMGRDLPVSVIRRAVPDLTEEDLGRLPSEIEKVYQAVEELNPFLLAMATKRIAVARRAGVST